VVATDRSTATLLAALVTFRAELDTLSLRFDAPHVDTTRKLRVATVGQLDDYVLPRLVQMDAPLLAVVGGSTGAGKSTLVNSLVGARVSASGVLRPTTRSPVLVHNPADAAWFERERILPELARTDTPATDVGWLCLMPSATVPPGLAILDAPDVDSVDAANRVLAAQLLDAADLWLFVTSASRYADEVPWNFLKAAAKRSAAVAVVLDRTPPESLEEVRVHLARMLTARGLRDSPLFSVPEGPVDDQGLLEPAAVRPIADWLHDLAIDPSIRGAIIAQTLDGAVRQMVFNAHDIADGAAEQIAISTRLHAAVETAFSDARSSIEAATQDGTLLRGEVLARWQEFVGAGDFVRSLEQRVGRIRDRFVDNVRGKRDRSDDILIAIGHGLHLMLLQNAEAASESVERSWVDIPAGEALLATDATLGRAGMTFRAHSELVVREWRDSVVEMVRIESANKRMTARFLAFGVDGVASGLMVVAFSRTAHRTPGTTDGAGAAGRLAEQLLGTIFGVEVVEELARRAHQDLMSRVVDLLASEKRRYLGALETADIDHGAADNIRDVARTIEDARHTDLVPDDWDQ